jgi:hypothetical protein
MAYYSDFKTEEYIWRCPQCGEDMRFANLSAVQRTEQAGGCQGCLATSTFQRKPEIIPLILDFWMRRGCWPHSSAWLEAAPARRNAAV